MAAHHNQSGGPRSVMMAFLSSHLSEISRKVMDAGQLATFHHGWNHLAISRRTVLAVILGGSLVANGPRVFAQSSLLDVLPTPAMVSVGFVTTAEGFRSLAEQATTFTDPVYTEQLLQEWGWQENAYRFFQAQYLPEIYIEISLTRFIDADGAKSAMPYFVQDRLTSTGAREDPIDPIVGVGDEVRQLLAPAIGGTDITLYVRSGPLVMRRSELIQEGDPVAYLDKVVQGIVERATRADLL